MRRQLKAEKNVRDLIIGIVVILVIAGVCYGLSEVRPELPATPSQPFSTATGPAPVSNEKIVMRVNGEGVSETEFNAIVRSAPEQMRTYYATEGGRRALADEIVRLKALAQEARRLGADQNAEVRSQIDLSRANILATYAVRNIVKQPTDAELRAEYEKSKDTFSSTSLSHILIAYKGGAVPPKSGGEPPSAAEAMEKAKRLVANIRAGANFGATAAVESDDAESGQRGGDLGFVSPDQLPPELGTAVMSLKPNQVSDPVQTRFGIHILKISERLPQPYERVKASLQQKVQQEKLQAVLDRLQKSAKVDLDPSFFGAGKEPAPIRRKAS